MKRPYVITAMIAIMMLTSSVLLTQGSLHAEQVLRYACSPQVYEAFGTERLEEFSRKTGIKVDLSIHSSAVAIERLMNGLADMASSAQRLTSMQVESGYVETPCCKDPMAIIVNTECPVAEITGQQLLDVFQGRIRNWKDLGGYDRPIVVVIPGEKTAAYQNFHHGVLGGGDVVFDIMTTRSTMVIEVTRRIPCSISFTSQGAARLITHGLKKLKINGLAPEDVNYPYYQVFSFVTRGTPSGVAKKFIDFALSKEGKEITRKKGMIPQSQ
jgi:phosphate transport system substrate-binding protein